MKVWIKKGLMDEPIVEEQVSQVCLMTDFNDPLVVGTMHGNAVIIKAADQEDFKKVLNSMGIKQERPIESV